MLLNKTDRDGSRIARNLAFWDFAPVERPLVGAYVGEYTSSVLHRIASDGELLRPEQVVPEIFFDCLEEECGRADALGTDLFMPVTPLYSVPWLEACLGLPLQVQGGSIWPHAILAEDEPLQRLELKPHQGWIDALSRSMRALAEHFGDRRPVAPPFLRGPVDVVTAMIGTSRACIGFYDHPHEMQALIATCADAWRDIARQMQRLIPRFCGGFVNNARWIYSPGPCAYSSEDSTSFLSMATFSRFLLPADQRISQAFPYGFMHRHSVSRQNIAGLLEMAPGWAIEITMDPTGPSVEEMLPLMREILDARRPLIVFGLNSEEDVAQLVSELPPPGLCVIIQADDTRQAERLLRIARDPRVGQDDNARRCMSRSAP